MPESTQTELSDEKAEQRAADGVHRLLDILTQEVSLVTRAANKRKWLVRKGDEMEGQEIFEAEGGALTTNKKDEFPVPVEVSEDALTEVTKELSMPAAVKNTVLQATSTALTRITTLLDNIKGAEESGDVSDVPPVVTGEFKGIATTLRGLISRYPSPKKKEEGLPFEAKKESDERVVDKGENKKAFVLPSGGAKAKLVAAASDAMKILEQCVNEIKGATEADAGSEPMPAQLSDKLEQAAAKLMSIVDGYPSHMSASAKKEYEEPTVEPVDKKASPFAILKEAHSTLGIVMTKLKPGQAIDEDSYQRLERLRALLTGIAGKKEDKEGEEEEEEKEKKLGKSESEDDPDNIAKAGARMARARRLKFQTAIKALIDLFKEVMPDSEIGKMPHLQVKKSAESIELEETKIKLEKAEKELMKANVTISELKQVPVDSNMSSVDSVIAPVATERVSWPLDLNTEFNEKRE